MGQSQVVLSPVGKAHLSSDFARLHCAPLHSIIPTFTLKAVSLWLSDSCPLLLHDHWPPCGPLSRHCTEWENLGSCAHSMSTCIKVVSVPLRLSPGQEVCFYLISSKSCCAYRVLLYIQHRSAMRIE